jgi:hypothetical protein
MPPQVSGQLVTTKSSKLVHVAGCDEVFALAGAALVATVSPADASAADASGQVASRRTEPVNAIRQAMRAIVPPYGQASKSNPFKLPSDLVGRYSMPEHLTSHRAMQVAAINWNRCRVKVSPNADIDRGNISLGACGDIFAIRTQVAFRAASHRPEPAHRHGLQFGEAGGTNSVLSSSARHGAQA